PELRLEFFVLFDLFRLDHREPKLERRLFYRWRRELQTAADRAIRLCNYQLDFETGCCQPLQPGHSELRCAANNQLHAHCPARTSFLILRLIRSRLSPLT